MSFLCQTIYFQMQILKNALGNISIINTSTCNKNQMNSVSRIWVINHSFEIIWEEIMKYTFLSICGIV